MSLLCKCLLAILMMSNLANAQTNAFEDQSIDSALDWLNENIERNSLEYCTVAHQTLKKVLKVGDYEAAAEIHFNLAHWNLLHPDVFGLDSSIYHAEQQIKYDRQLGNKEYMVDGYLNLAIAYMNAKRLEKAQKSILDAIQLIEENNEEEGVLASAYSNLSELNFLMKKPHKAIEYANLCLKIHLEGEESPEMGDNEFTDVVNALTYKYEAYMQLEDYQNATIVADQVCQIAQGHQLLHYQRALIFCQQFKGRVYLAQQTYDQAIEQFKKAWQLGIDFNQGQVAERYRSDLGEALYLQGEYEAALPHLKAGLQAWENYDSEFFPKYYLRLSECYQQLGHLENALEYRIKGFELQDKLKDEKIANLESEAVIKYETGKKDQALAEQETIIQQNQRIQWLGIGLITLLLVFLSTLFYYFRRNKKTTQALAVKNQENELLLKEIHHRVKNNLEMVSSLLKLESVKTPDSGAKSMMQASQNRVQSMGIIHQKLYQGKNLGAIEMLDYFRDLSENLIDAFGANDQVEINYDMKPVELDVDTAIPIGLIVNELLTNSLKYAFPENKKGKIQLSLMEIDNKQLRLVVADNGIGKKETTTIQGTGFGSQLIQLLTTQLQGNMKADYQNGTKLTFQLEKAQLN